ncbi:hypothetical protein MMC30_004758 [Trapelia coarctata]|nr:hypothetical protein [Trapelia coarctata]
MFCLIQFYIQLRSDEDVASKKPFIKVLSIKLVIFLSFWQTITISLLTSSGAIKQSPRIATPDLQIGIPAMLLCIEMAFFSILHLWAYPWKVYTLTHPSHNLASSTSDPNFRLDGPGESYKGGRLGIKAFLDAFNPWDLVKAIGRGFRWLFVGRKHREKDISYQSQLPQNVNPDSTTYNPSKPGKYIPLHDNDSDVNVPFVQHEHPHPFTHEAQQSFSKPFNSSRGDLGTVGVMKRGYDGEGVGEEEFRPQGPMPAGGTAYARPAGDTAYYGAQGRQAWADPRSHWGGRGNGGQI